MQLVLGVDTSNYTTSLCALDYITGELVAESRKLLPVAAGERGLRQSEALFFHVQQLPVVMRELMTQIGTSNVTWRAVGVSFRPRPLATSYMPAFLAGAQFATTLGTMLGIPVVRTSHQEGHLAAADRDFPMDGHQPHIAVHLSGGTSDVLLARRTRFGYAVRQVGESQDLNAGQFVDRVGVALGLPFPSGRHLERIVSEGATSTSEEMLRFSASVRGASMSFSGPCTAALRAIDAGYGAADVGAAVFQTIANSVVKAVDHATAHPAGPKYCLLAGGVMANLLIRSRILHRLHILHPDLEVIFAPVAYASDNALGPATIAWRWLQSDGSA